MSITVATAVVAPSAPSPVAAPAALPAGARDLAFQKLLETFSSAATAAGGGSTPPAARAWAGATMPGAMPAGVAGALDTTKGGTARYGTDAPLEADGRTPQPGDASDQTAALGTAPVLQVLPLPMPAPLPAAAPASPADGSAAARGSAPSIAAAADTVDRRTSATGPAATDVARTRADGSAAAGSTDVQASAQAPDFELQGPDDRTNPSTRVVTTSPSPTAAGVNPAETAGVRSGAGVRTAAAGVGGAAVEGSNIASPQVAVASTDLQNQKTSGVPVGPQGSARPPADANAQADRLTDGSRAASILPATTAVQSHRPDSLRSGVDVQPDARPAAEQVTRKPASPAPADRVGPNSAALGPQIAVSPRDQAPAPVPSPAATPAENQGGVAAERRSAAGVRLAAALARGGRTEGPSGARPEHGNRVAAQATTMPVDADPQNVSTAGRIDVNAQADRLGERLRSEPLTFGAAVSAVEQVPVRAGAAESVLRSDVTLPAEPATDIKASGLAALLAAPISVLGIGGSSSHAVSAAVATTAQPELDPAAESDLPRQIVQAMRLQWKDGIGDARIRLLPEYLGELSVAIRVEHGSVTAALEASTPAVRQWIESHEPMLRQSLAEQGLHLDRLIVLDEPEQTTANQNRERRREKGEEAQQQQQRQSRRRQPADDTTFEVIV